MRTHCCEHIVAHDVSWVRKLGNIYCGHKMFLNKIRNTKCVSATNVARGANGETFVSATICLQQ